MRKLVVLFLAWGSLASALPLETHRVINPVGDESLGYLLIQAPTEPMVGREQIAPFTLSVKNVKMNVGTPNRLAQDTHSLVMISPLIGMNIEKKISILQRQTTKEDIAALNFAWDPKLIRVEVGPEAVFVVSGTNTKGTFQVGSGQTWPANSKDYLYAPVFADEYRAQFQDLPVLGSWTAQVQPGQVISKSVDFPEMRATLILTSPQKTYPDALPMTEHCGQSTNVVQRRDAFDQNLRFHVPFPVLLERWGGVRHRSGLESIVDAYKTSLKAETMIRFFPVRDDNMGALNYELVVNNSAMALKMSAGQTYRLEIPRIDVNDVLVTREDGVQEYVAGTYDIYVPNPEQLGGWKLLEMVDWPNCFHDAVLAPGDFKTKTGVNVVPGVYKVVVTYPTQEGTKVHEQIVDLR